MQIIPSLVAEFHIILVRALIDYRSASLATLRSNSSSIPYLVAEIHISLF